ncbi:ABC transporter ATP-binding protein [Consotaella aegiceratis]|uniref:ABC transporter ATP-binding protein n=1 Tax=Consotaella aegiceratis TaxID=3097961 RepID=UPI002F412635
MRRQSAIQTAAQPRGPGAVIAGAKPRDLRGALRRVWHALSGHHLAIVITIVLSLASVTGSAIGPWQLGKATDILAEAAESGTFSKAALVSQLVLVVAIYLAASGLNLVQAWMINELVQTMGRRLRSEAQAKLDRVPLSWFDAQPHGEVLSRFTNDIDNIVQNFQQVASQAMLMLLTIIGVVVMMVVLSPPLACVALTAIAASLTVTRIIARLAHPFFTSQWRETGHLNAIVEESFAAQSLIKVFGARERIEQRFRARNDALVEASLTGQILGSMIQPTTMFVTNLAYIAVVALGGFRVLAGALSLGELQAFIQYIRQIGQPISQLGSMATLVQSALASAERVFEFLDAGEMDPEGEKSGTTLPVPLRGEVRFEHVHFRYRPDRPLFEDISLEAQPGQMLAIVGPTGAGKTTLVNLLMRFYEVGGGRILLDGVDICGLSRVQLRQAMGMVLQDTWLFTGTVHDNIAYGRPEASREEVVAAARRCHVDEFVRTLPGGYDTLLENAGASLSQGQRQLMTIARAFLLSAPVLILDEATSSVDTRTEMQIQTAMAELRQGRTSFVIAHRLSTIRNADLIVYMEAGTVQEVGTHGELLALRGGYWRLSRTTE